MNAIVRRSRMYDDPDEEDSTPLREPLKETLARVGAEMGEVELEKFAQMVSWIKLVRKL